MEIRRATGPEDYARAALVLGEQRAWIENLLDEDLSTVQPCATTEYASLASYYRPPLGALVLALEGDDPIGVVGVRVRDDGRAELKRMYVRPRRRARGSGTALLTEAIAAAQDLGCAEVVLDTDRVHMAAAFALYRRFGFRTIPPLDAWAAPTATGMVLELRALALSRAA